MDDTIKRLLLESKTLLQFSNIIFKNNLSRDSWKNDSEVIGHREFLQNQEIPPDILGENMEFFRYSLRKSKEEREKRRHSN